MSDVDPCQGVVTEVAVTLMRHGRSMANEQGTFCGWADAPLSPTGIAQVRHAGQQLAAQHLLIDVVHTSCLSRAEHSARMMLDAWQGREVPIHRDWRLNERHLGELQGLTRNEVVRRWGNRTRQRWRSDPAAAPPALHRGDPAHPVNQACYAAIRGVELPGSESIEDLARRVLLYWHEAIAPDISAGRNVLVVSHRDPIRVLVAHLTGIDNRFLPDLPVHPASPIRFRLSTADPCRTSASQGRVVRRRTGNSACAPTRGRSRNVQ